MLFASGGTPYNRKPNIKKKYIKGELNTWTLKQNEAKNLKKEKKKTIARQVNYILKEIIKEIHQTTGPIVLAPSGRLL